MNDLIMLVPFVPFVQFLVHGRIFADRAVRGAADLGCGLQDCRAMAELILLPIRLLDFGPSRVIRPSNRVRYPDLTRINLIVRERYRDIGCVDD